MIFSGVFARHPKLRFVAAEVNVGRVPYWTQQMYMTIERQYMKGNGDWYPKLPTRHPEDYIGTNIFSTVLDDRLGLRLVKGRRQTCGRDNVVDRLSACGQPLGPHAGVARRVH
jgi:hypothetical protein